MMNEQQESQQSTKAFALQNPLDDFGQQLEALNQAYKKLRETAQQNNPGALQEPIRSCYDTLNEMTTMLDSITTQSVRNPSFTQRIEFGKQIGGQAK